MRTNSFYETKNKAITSNVAYTDNIICKTLGEIADPKTRGPSSIAGRISLEK